MVVAIHQDAIARVALTTDAHAVAHALVPVGDPIVREGELAAVIRVIAVRATPCNVGQAIGEVIFNRVS